ncbi:hypothetical protein [Halopseudomonas sp.]|jgi:hypothetical protein|uniref:hypothetical protein n=1 Tax=Halopseudomonas sp. TaxID=2901191 RepID=UPI0039E2D829
MPDSFNVLEEAEDIEGVQVLRQFHFSHRSPSSPFRPMPDGFAPVQIRKTLPKGGE